MDDVRASYTDDLEPQRQRNSRLLMIVRREHQLRIAVVAPEKRRSDVYGVKRLQRKRRRISRATKNSVRNGHASEPAHVRVYGDTPLRSLLVTELAAMEQCGDTSQTLRLN